MKKLLIVSLLSLGLTSFANAEVVTNNKGEKIELKPNGTWVKIKESPLDNNRPVLADTPLTINVEDGNNNPVPIKVYVKITSEPEKSLTVKELTSRVNLTAFQIKLRLKNKYTFIPRSAMATLNGRSLEVFMEYTAKNSYGADVVGHDIGRFALNEAGNYAPVY